MPKFHITFGQRYRHEPHGRLTPDECHPAGYGTIIAPDYDRAQELAAQECGVVNGCAEYCAIYIAGEFDYGFYPRGQNFIWYYPSEVVHTTCEHCGGDHDPAFDCLQEDLNV